MYIKMNSPDLLDFKANPRQLYPNPSARQFPKRDPLPPYNIGAASKPIRVRHTDHTDERNSERSQSHFTGPESQQRVGDLNTESCPGESRVTNQGYQNNDNVIRILSEREEKVVELRERLKNIHHFYRIRIEEERSKNVERNEIFIGIIEELQRNHNDRVAGCRKTLEEMEEEKQELGYVDERMGNVKTTI